MIAPDIETGIAALRALIDGARVVLPFTGAGISTECGIPDFRSPGGLWTKNRPIPFDEFLASQEMGNEAWGRGFAMAGRFAARGPGPRGEAERSLAAPRLHGRALLRGGARTRASRARKLLPHRQGAGGDHTE